MLFVVLLFVLSSNSFGAETITLSNVTDFIEFVVNVNSGSNYSGTTVYLGSDITLSESINPICTDNYHFLGVFDGQGYIISDLEMNTSSEYTGLFGYSGGLTIRNVVLDGSCSITNSYSGSGYAYVGGIIGCCWEYSGQCNIENSVNMADVTFSGNISKNNMHIGGIVGGLSSSSYNVYVKNCVNYGSVTHSGIVSGSAELGGIVGFSQGSSSSKIYVQNCLNYGTITRSGTTTSELHLGGITGSSYYAYIENCVSAGKISMQTTATGNNSYIGSIAGNVEYSGTHINYCYYTSDVGVSSVYGHVKYTLNITGTPSATIGTPNSTTNVSSELVSKLNSNATSCNWDKWFMLHLNGGSINNLTQELLVEIQGHIPNPVKEGNIFLFWCKDADCTEKFDPEKDNISGITNLYVAWVNNTVIFNVSGGDPLPEDKATKTVTYNGAYGDFPEPNRTEYMFIGWFTMKNEKVTNETIVTVPYNHTLYAHWEEVTARVEIVFSSKDLTKKEVEELLKQYTKADFEITKFEKSNGGINVIIKFASKKDAKNFVEIIKGSSEMGQIKKIDFLSSDDGSFSTMIYPFPFLSVLFL